MERLRAQLKSLKDSASKALVQPGKVLGFGGEVQPVPYYSSSQNDSCLFLTPRLLSDQVPKPALAPKSLFPVNLPYLGW